MTSELVIYGAPERLTVIYIFYKKQYYQHSAVNILINGWLGMRLEMYG